MSRMASEIFKTYDLKARIQLGSCERSHAMRLHPAGIDPLSRMTLRDHVSPRIGPTLGRALFSSVHEELEKSPNRHRDPGRPCSIGQGRA
jgi:hypothetical protein